MLVYYDGVCALCNRFVSWALRHDSTGQLRFAALESAHGDRLRREFPEARDVDSIIVREGSHIATKSDAVLAIARRLGLSWMAATLRIVPRRLRDWGYDLVARRRYAWFGRYDSCPVPPPAVRDRFLERERAD
jgi:predicted DCC family thiol-disulfide oxidoreductase YuxK